MTKKGRPARIVTNEECARLNSLRILYVGKPFSRKELEKLLKDELGWPLSGTTQQLIAKLFIHVDRTTYAFPKEPVHIKKIQKIFDDMRIYRQKRYSSAKPQLVEVEEIKNPIQDAIKLLKNNGFKVIKEYFNVSEALKNPNMPASTFIKVQEF